MSIRFQKVHMLERTPFHLPEFLSLKGPAFSLMWLSEKPFGQATAIEPWDRFDIEDSASDRLSGNLFASTSSSGHIFIDREDSREAELAEDL